MNTTEEGISEQNEVPDPERIDNMEKHDTPMVYDPIHREIEIYENQRFNFQQLSAMGWSSNGLLPTDRNMLSTKCGRYDWPSYAAANQDLISHGWTWDGDWKVDTSLPGTDEEGWGYAVSFGSIDAGTSATKEMKHFVRRRRLTRTRVFYMYSSAEETCRYCDSVKIEMLSAAMFESITKASLHENAPSSPENSASDISPKISNDLMSALVDTLHIGEDASSFAPSADDKLSLLEVQHLINTFLETLINKKSIWGKTKSRTRSMMSSSGDVDHEVMLRRQHELQSLGYVDVKQFRYMAIMCIRKYDSENHYHCKTRRCSSECPFFPHACTNERCGKVISQKYRQDHDDECPWKVLECTKGCGDHIPRREMETHLMMACGLREDTCPFAALGCMAQGIAHKDLPEHLDHCMQSHLMLTLTRMMEQQSVIKRLNKEVKQLSGRVDSHDKSIIALDAAAATTALAIRNVKKEASQLEAKAAKTIEKKVDKDLKSVANDVTKMNKTVDAMRRKSEARDAELAAAGAKREKAVGEVKKVEV